MSAARHSENISCSGVMSTALHGTHSHSFVYISTTSGANVIDHFKFRVELVQALLIEHGSESIRKFQGHHSTDKNVLRLIERHFPERIPDRKKGQANKEVCSVLQK